MNLGTATCAVEVDEKNYRIFLSCGPVLGTQIAIIGGQQSVFDGILRLSISVD